MNYDDPERRIADLERRQAEWSATQPAPPHGGRPAAEESVWRTYWQLQMRKRFPKWCWLVVAALAAGLLFGVGVGVHDIHRYRSGTPAVATIVTCTSMRGGQSDCTVRWYEGGRARTGQLHRVDGRPLVGSRVNVRVNGDDAYVGTSGRADVIGGSIGFGVILVLVVLSVAQRRRMRRGGRTAR
jgi:hypothetical protein